MGRYSQVAALLIGPLVVGLGATFASMDGDGRSTQNPHDLESAAEFDSPAARASSSLTGRGALPAPVGGLRSGAGCPGGESIPLEMLGVAQAEYGLFVEPRLPDSEIARPEDAWNCSGYPVVLFDNGAQVTYEAGWRDVDTESKFRARSVSEGQYLELKGGVPAYLWLGDESYPQQYLVFASGDLGFKIYPGKPLSRDELVLLANSLLR